MATIDVRRAAPARARVGFWWFALTAVAIAVFAPLPYLTNSLQSLAENQSGLAENFVSRPLVVQAALYVHILFGSTALLLSPLQFVRRLREGAPRVHRVVGRVVLASIGLAGSAGVVLSATSLAGPIGTAGFGLLGILWVAFAVVALRAILRSDVESHRRWMVRTFALTYAAVTLRIWLGLLIGVQIGLTGVDASVAFSRAYLVVPFLCWVPNLLVGELYLRKAGLTSVR